MNVEIDLQIASVAEGLPDENSFLRWATAALEGAKHGASSELNIRVIDELESQTLNREFRQQDKPTNVLSFPCELPEGVDVPLLGDLAICAPVVQNEAQAQNKTEEAHWAHMTVHGTLHLLGYDHISDDEAEIMETLETQILTMMGYEAPYE